MRAKLGQHFLANPAIAGAIVDAALLSPGDPVLEIGPGRGALTEGLLDRGCAVTAVEKDPALARRLEERYKGRELKVVRADVLDIEAPEALFDPAASGRGPLKLVGNLPYGAASAILRRALQWPSWKLAVFMFQKEVADRILSKPGQSDYGLLTLSVWPYAEAEFVLEAAPEDFRPRPQVRSTVLRLRRRAAPKLPPELECPFFTAVRAAFRERRKTAANSMARALGAAKGDMEEALEAEGVPRNARGQDIPPEAYLGLCGKLAQKAVEGH